jgi:hypothetical protein
LACLRIGVLAYRRHGDTVRLPKDPGSIQGSNVSRCQVGMLGRRACRAVPLMCDRLQVRTYRMTAAGRWDIMGHGSALFWA